MSAKPRDLPRHAPLRRLEMDSSFARRVLGRREARRLAELMDDAEQRARARLETAREEAERIFAEARAEAMALLARLPDFAALEASPVAMRAIRDTADKHGLSIAVVLGKERHSDAGVARCDAVRAVAAACPKITEAEICALFSGLSSLSVHRMLVRSRR